MTKEIATWQGHPIAVGDTRGQAGMEQRVRTEGHDQLEPRARRYSLAVAEAEGSEESTNAETGELSPEAHGSIGGEGDPGRP